jgi:hypothetical protein
VPEREFVRGVAVLVKNVSFAPLGLGLKPRIIFVSNAALKRRSSTVLRVSIVLDTSEPQGLKPISIATSNGTAEAVP